jgi:redox-sensitive bicupin YhaK (pirin superfamily)
VHLHQQDAVLWAVRLDEGQTVTIPAAPHVHVFVARGSARLSASIDLTEGDAVRLTDEREQELAAAADTEVLVWEV